METSTIISEFKISSQPVKITRWGEGHIHETYLVETADHSPDYILQKINGNVFRNIPGMMQNIGAVCRHFKEKLSDLPGHDPEKEALTLVDTKDGKAWHEDKEGNCWRVYVYIPDTVIYQKITDPKIAFEVGRAISFFQSMLSDMKEPLIDTIPDFHNIDFRISQYYQAKGIDPEKRLPAISTEIKFAKDRFQAMRSYMESLKEKAVLRATHNDTKVNNVLFDQNSRALCLIDLDTVMPGYVHFDYGDALRTMANTALEDERDLEKVRFNLPVYEAFTRGYLQEAGGFLNEDELKMLPYAPVYLTFIIGLRFLTDYLNGDIYFRIHHPDHNLVRARVQFKLVSEMERLLF
jgi:Ser/Thr protein kinase RdoA (MazF antagonist)